MVAGAVLLSACGGGGDKAATGEHQVGAATGDCAPSGTSLSISADNIKFSTDCLAAPAGQKFTVKFDNLESVPHNFAILGTDGKTLAGTEVTGGPRVDTLEAGPLEAGTYSFHCAVHPQMTGTFVVK